MIHFNDAINYDNLMDAYFHCRKGKSTRPEVVDFHRNRDQEIRRLLRELNSESYDVTGLFTFTIYEPKKRDITANEFRDKIVEYVLSNYVLKPVIGPKLIEDNYATQDGKGTKAAFERAIHHIKSFTDTNGYTDKGGYVFSADIHHFFYKINREICFRQVNKLDIDDKLKRLLHRIIYAIAKFDGSKDGLCIGFQTSQWLAVFYLDELDHIIKEKLHCKHYGRYMDDFWIIHNDKGYLKKCKDLIEEYLNDELYLAYNPKSEIHKLSKGLLFVGYRFTYNQRTHEVEAAVLNSKVRNQRKKQRKLKTMVDEDKIDESTAMESVTAWYAYASRGETEASKNAYAEAKRLFLHTDGSPTGIDIAKRSSVEDIDRDQDGFYKLRKRIKKKGTNANYSERVHAEDRTQRKFRNNCMVLNLIFDRSDETVLDNIQPIQRQTKKPSAAPRQVYDLIHHKK